MRAQRRGLALVAGRAVGAGELVQPRAAVAGVADVAAHGGVGPLAVAVAVEAQVQLDQLATPRRSSSLENRSACIRLRVILAPDDLVVVERDPAAGLEPPGARLADVVHQRGEAQHEVRAGIAARGPASSAIACSSTVSVCS